MKFLIIYIFFVSVGAKADIPAWFQDYIKTNPGCEKDYLCSTGEGESLAEALSDARLEAAKFFKNKIEAKSEISTSSTQQLSNQTKESVSTNFNEWTNKTINEETSEIISGLEIRRQEKINGHYFVLLSLEREKLAKNIKGKIEILDCENLKLTELNSRFTIPKILKNLMIIENLNDRYYLLSSIPLKLKINKEYILDKMNKLLPITIGLLSRSKKLPSRMNHSLIDLLSSLKIIVVSNKLFPKYTLRSDLVIEEQYLKVEGFKKLTIQFRLEIINSKLHILGKMSALSEQVARNSDQAIEKSIPEIMEDIQNNLDQFSNIKLD